MSALWDGLEQVSYSSAGLFNTHYLSELNSRHASLSFMTHFSCSARSFAIQLHIKPRLQITDY